MKLLKKIVAFTLALTMIASFASCSKKANEDSSESSESSSSSSETSANDSSSAAVSGDETAAVTEAPPAPLVYKDLKGDHFAEASGHKISEDEYKYYFSYAKSIVKSWKTNVFQYPYSEQDVTVVLMTMAI